MNFSGAIVQPGSTGGSISNDDRSVFRLEAAPRGEAEKPKRPPPVKKETSQTPSSTAPHSHGYEPPAIIGTHQLHRAGKLERNARLRSDRCCLALTAERRKLALQPKTQGAPIVDCLYKGDLADDDLAGSKMLRHVHIK
jgi:hypothetical protein